MTTKRKTPVTKKQVIEGAPKEQEVKVSADQMFSILVDNGKESFIYSILTTDEEEAVKLIKEKHLDSGLSIGSNGTVKAVKLGD